MIMPRVIHFEISADDPARAGQFYSDVFGWNVQKWDGPVDYWLVTTGDKSQPGIDGAIMPRAEGAAPTTNTIDVPSVDEYVEKVVAAGGKVLAAKQAVPGVGYFAYGQDT